MKQILLLVLGCALLWANGLRANEFSSIMKSMEKNDITFDHFDGERDYKVYKGEYGWMLNYPGSSSNSGGGESESEIIDEGNNRISTHDWPDHWVIHGSWRFSKMGDKCRYDHENVKANLTWECKELSFDKLEGQRSGIRENASDPSKTKKKIHTQKVLDSAINKKNIRKLEGDSNKIENTRIERKIMVLNRLLEQKLISKEEYRANKTKLLKVLLEQ